MPRLEIRVLRTRYAKFNQVDVEQFENAIASVMKSALHLEEAGVTVEWSMLERVLDSTTDLTIDVSYTRWEYGAPAIRDRIPRASEALKKRVSHFRRLLLPARYGRIIIRQNPPPGDDYEEISWELSEQLNNI